MVRWHCDVTPEALSSNRFLNNDLWFRGRRIPYNRRRRWVGVVSSRWINNYRFLRRSTRELTLARDSIYETCARWETDFMWRRKLALEARYTRHMSHKLSRGFGNERTTFTFMVLCKNKFRLVILIVYFAKLAGRSTLRIGRGAAKTCSNWCGRDTVLGRGWEAGETSLVIEWLVRTCSSS